MFQDRLLFDYTGTVNRCLEAGASSVALVLNPPSQSGWREGEPSDDPARHRVLGRIIQQIADANPERVKVIDLWNYVDENGLEDDRDARPDGIHWTPEASTEIADDFLVSRIFRAAAVNPPSASTTRSAGTS